MFEDIGAIRTTRPGQCDENGMPERSVWVSNCFEYGARHEVTLYYEIVASGKGAAPPQPTAMRPVPESTNCEESVRRDIG